MEKYKKLGLDQIQIEQSDILPASSNTTQLVLMHSLVDMRSGVEKAMMADLIETITSTLQIINMTVICMPQFINLETDRRNERGFGESN